VLRYFSAAAGDALKMPTWICYHSLHLRWLRTNFILG
jgi:hypothetical protein